MLTVPLTNGFKKNTDSFLIQYIIITKPKPNPKLFFERLALQHGKNQTFWCKYVKNCKTNFQLIKIILSLSNLV